MLAELVATERIDTIHTRGVAAAKFATKAIEPFATRLVLGCGDEALAHGRDRAFSRALLRADRILAHSGYLADLLIEAHAIPRERAIVVPRRIDTALFDPSAVAIERIAALRQTWSVQRGERIVLVPATIDPANGQHVLIEAARMLVSGGLRHVVFVLAGDKSPQPAYALALATGARAHGIGHLVRQVGICPDMPAAYAAADFVALPAMVPPTFGRAAAEALAMGRPVVASELGALPELVLSPPRAPESARTGWLVAPADPVALARGLAAAEALDLAALSSVGAQARRLATLLLSPGQIIAAVLAVYTGLLENNA
ncbi:MAG TPA: glycosyltransferase family 4 protein [Xanthobacteraceae bacterium]